MGAVGDGVMRGSPGIFDQDGVVFCPIGPLVEDGRNQREAHSNHTAAVTEKERRGARLYQEDPACT